MSASGACSAFSKVSTDRKVWTGLAEHLSDRQARLNAPLPLRPPPLSTGPQLGPLQGMPTTLGSQLLRPLPLVALLLLHYLTLGIYSFLTITATLGALPKVRNDDPSSAKAIGLCFLPLFNMYWICLIYPRLAQRINGTCASFGLRPTVPLALAYAVSACMVIPLVLASIGLIAITILSFAYPKESHFEAWLVFFILPHSCTALNYLIVWPWFCGSVQLGINRVFELQLAMLLSQGASVFSPRTV
ncbi:MAG: hypothetical protein ACKVP0_10610 [Pirellulaceae bacterium]